MLIAYFGLLGLAVLTGAQRTKEIGVRKVLGASALGLVMLLSKDFLRLVAVAFVLAVPLAWFNLDLWLAQFAYRVDLTPGVFLLAGAAVLLVAWLTVSYQAVRAALANPVDSLRYE
jgi:putative ABC transport system permease protein